MKRVKVLSFLFVLMLGPLSVFAQENDGPPPHRGWGRGFHHHRHHGGRGFWFGNREYMKEDLGLSDSQIEKIAGINASYRDKMVDVRKKLAPLKEELRQLLMQKNVELAKVRKVLNKIALIEVDLRFFKIQHRLELEKLLTPKQKEQLREERMERRQRRRHGGMMND